MKVIISFLMCFILCGSLLASASQPSGDKLKQEIDLSRNRLKTLTENNAPVMKQYDVFVEAMLIAYKNGEGIVSEDVSRVIKAIDFAAEKHRLQKRKAPEGTPYIIHPIGVAHSLMTIGHVRDMDIITAAVLHDTVEDTATTFSEINEQFGPRVENFVRELTDDKSLPKAERKRLQIVNASHKSAGAAQIKLADKLYNLTDLLFTPPTDWDKTRIDEYFQWAQSVVDALPWVNAPLKAAVDVQIQTYKNQKNSG